ncbi:MAG: PD-(D/E)XK nuclease family protein [Rhodothermia bacterium]|nr:PD-(D/E)XK nuclease family protein [Rhodothermia bacterium]
MFESHREARVTHPGGEEKISYVIEQLQEFCRKNPVGRKLLIVPSKQVGYNLTTSLALHGLRWVNLHVETPLSLAEWYAAPVLNEKAERLSADGAAFVVHRILSSALDAAGPDDQFRKSLAVSPGLVRAIANTISDLRLAGVSSARLAKAGIDPAKASFLGEVYQAYERAIAREGQYDSADVYRVGIERVKSLGCRYESVAVLDEVEVAFLPFKFFTLLRDACGEFSRIGRNDFQVDPPRRTVASRFDEISFPTTGTQAVHPAGQIRIRELEPHDKSKVQLRDAVGVDAEVRGVFRDVRSMDVPLDSVEVAYTTSQPYLPLIANAAYSLGLPITLSEGLPIRLGRCGQAVIGFYRWIANGLDANGLSHLLRSRVIRIPWKGGQARKPRRCDIAETLDVRKAGRGRDEILDAFARQRRQIEAEEASGFGRDSKRKIERLTVGREAVERLLGIVPEMDHSSVAKLAQAGLRFLADYFRPASEVEAQMLESILDRLRAISEMDISGPTASLSSLIQQLLESHHSAASVAREGHLYVVPVERAGYSGRPYTFVVGLDEGSFPGGGMESPVLLDEERAKISSRLPDFRSRPAERTWHLLRMLGTLEGPVTLTANRFDVVDGRERYASSIYAQCREDLDLENPIRYTSVPALEEAISESDAWLSQRRSAQFVDAAVNRYPLLAAGLTATTARNSPELTRFDGYLGRAAPELSLRDQKAISASRLERLAECPHRYFLQHVLYVEPPDEIDPEDNRWLDAREFGKLVHELLCEFMMRLQERSERPDLDRHRSEILDLAEQYAESACERIPPETPLAYRAGLRQIKTAAQIFLAAESRSDPDVEPIHFELKFGGGAEGSRHPRPVEIGLGKYATIRLRGSIDRVDRTSSGFKIWDYKTGSSAPFDRTNPFKGEKLQWALYAFAFENLMKGLPTNLEVTESGYFFVGDREYGRRISHEVPDRDVVGRYLSPLLEMAERGAFFHFQKRDTRSSPCKFCDYRSVCSSERKFQSDLPAALEKTKSKNEILELLSEWMKSL